jgi:hypothetical protein
MKLAIRSTLIEFIPILNVIPAKAGTHDPP